MEEIFCLKNFGDFPLDADIENIISKLQGLAVTGDKEGVKSALIEIFPSLKKS